MTKSKKTPWTPGPPTPRAEGDAVHLWRVDLDVADNLVEDLRGLLSEDELARADRFVYEIHGARFVVGRGVLRRLLAAYLGAQPESLRFGYGPKGKPRLEQPDADGLQFNVSHSGGRALIAVSQGREVGVDVERINAERAAEAIARRFFAPAEVAEFLSLPDDERVVGFFNAWTRKEAYMKATGQGLALGLDRFRVSLRPGEQAKLIETAWCREDVHRWSMQAFDPGAGFAAAVVAEGDRWNARFFDLRKA